MKSVWDDAAALRGTPLKGDTAVEAVVIGGGIAGLLIARELRERGIQATVMEALEPLRGVTRYTTAKVTSQHGLRYAHLARAYGTEAARVYAETMQRAVERYEEIIARENIDCDWQRRPAFLYSEQDDDRLHEELAAAKLVGLPAEADRLTELPFPTTGALRFDRQASFHPLRFLAAAAREVPIWTHTFAQFIDGHMIFTDRGCVTARHIVVATHFPFINFPGLYFARLHEERHRVTALEGAPAFEGMYRDIDPQGFSFRSAGDLLLCGTDGRRTGDTRTAPPPEHKLRLLFPGSTVAARFWTQDCITHDWLPFIGRYAASRPDWYVATGFNTWGMTTSLVAAEIIADLILGKETPAARLFSPQRRLSRTAVGPFVRDRGRSANGLTAGLLSRSERRCPHMGCRLQYNETDRVWECPCHGSVFDKRGRWCYGPSTDRRLENPPKGD